MDIKTIQFKRGTKQDLLSWEGIPDNGEPIFELNDDNTSSGLLKIGDGHTNYRDLPYVSYSIVPKPTQEDVGKVLMVNSSGKYELVSLSDLLSNN